MSKNDGFTLLEALIVLMIFMLISSSAVMITTSQIDEKIEKNFFRQFNTDILQMQAMALAEAKYVYMDFSQNGKKYAIKHQNTLYVERELPNGINLTEASYLRVLGFHPNGTVSQFGWFLFEVKGEQKKITVNIGQGKLLYEE